MRVRSAGNVCACVSAMRKTSMPDGPFAGSHGEGPGWKTALPGKKCSISMTSTTGRRSWKTCAAPVVTANDSSLAAARTMERAWGKGRDGFASSSSAAESRSASPVKTTRPLPFCTSSTVATPSVPSDFFRATLSSGGVISHARPATGNPSASSSSTDIHVVSTGGGGVESGPSAGGRSVRIETTTRRSKCASIRPSSIAETMSPTSVARPRPSADAACAISNRRAKTASSSADRAIHASTRVPASAPSARARRIERTPVEVTMRNMG